MWLFMALHVLLYDGPYSALCDMAQRLYMTTANYEIQAADKAKTAEKKGQRGSRGVFSFLLVSFVVTGF